MPKIVEYIVRDRNLVTHRPGGWTKKEDAAMIASLYDRLYFDAAPHRVIKRTITEEDVTDA